MSQFSAGTKTPPPSTSPPSDSPYKQGHRRTNSGTEPFPDHRVSTDISRPNTPPSRPDYGTPLNGGSPIEPSTRRRRSSSAASSRPPSMVLAHQPPIMDITEDTIPELQPIYSFLNSHSNKLYQEGYFLKLDDQNTRMLNPDPIAVFTIPTYLPLTPRGLHIQLFTHVLQGCPANDFVNRG
jgi:CCR4-NOT transcriptional complex subunit CAF120